MTVLIYQDYVHNHGLLYRSLCRHFGADNVGFCDAEDIMGGALGAGTDLFVMPGGADLYYCEKLNGAGNAAIRSYVEDGGVYLGLCAGAYYACAEIEWAKGGEQEIAGPRELAFFPGKAAGPVPEFIEEGDVAKSWQAAVSLNYDDGTVRRECLVPYMAGPVFVSAANNDFQIIGFYEDLPGSPAAIVSCPVGAGKAVLCSPHLEVTHEGLSRRQYRHLNNSIAWEQGVADKLKKSETPGRQLWAQFLNFCVQGNP